MSIQLTIDEMLDFLVHADAPGAKELQLEAEILATRLAMEIEMTFPELTCNGLASFEGADLGGTCAPFRPTTPGPVPEVLEHFGVEVQEWKDMCDEQS